MRLSLADHLIILLIVVALSISGFSGYLLWSGWPNAQHLEVVRQQSALLDKFDRPTATAGPPAQSAGVLTQIYNRKAAGFTTDTQGRLLIVEESPARIISLDLNTNHTQAIGDLGQGVPQRVIWSQSRKLVLVELIRNSISTWKLITLDPFKITNLPANTVQATFSPDETELAIFRTSASAQTFELVLRPISGTVAKTILTTRTMATELAWPEHDTLSVVLTRDDQVGSLFLVSRAGALSPIQSEIAGAQTNWSSLGNKALISWNNTDATHTAWINLESINQHPLNIATRATSCAWLNDEITLWCPVPREYSSDILAIDTQTNQSNIILDSSTRGNLPALDRTLPIENGRALIARTADQHTLLKFTLPQ